MIISRFAPSPTGRLHLGHAFSALRAHDFARTGGGIFLLRIEDIDPTRCRPEHIEGIFDDLRWLGIGWDGAPVLQSQRYSHYAAALDRLKAMALAYPCFCTRAQIAAEIVASASAPHGPAKSAEATIFYPGTCRHLSDDERARRIAAGEPHAWRLDIERAAARAGPLDWDDAGAGRIAAAPAIQGDIVLARKDAPASYHLAVTIDDATQGVTDVVRGEDLFAATHVHRLLQALLDLPTPRYHHHRLIADDSGARLAKRHGAPTLQSMREDGVDPALLVAKLRSGG